VKAAWRFDANAALAKATLKRGEEMWTYFEGLSRYFFFLVGPDLTRWSRFLRTLQVIAQDPSSLQATELWGFIFTWMAAIATVKPASYDFAPPPGDDDEWHDEALDLFIKAGWSTPGIPSAAWWAPEPFEPIYVFETEDAIAAGIRSHHQGWGAEWIVMMGDVLPPEFHSVSTWTSIVAAARVLPHCEPERLIRRYCRWIGRLVDFQGRAEAWNGAEGLHRLRGQWKFLECVMLSGDDLKRHELEWMQKGGALKVGVARDVPMFMMEDAKHAGLPKLLLALKDRAGQWKEAETIMDTGGVLSLAGRGCAGIIREQDCVKLKEPVIIRSLTGERTKLYLSWSAVLRLGSPGRGVEARVSLLVCPKYQGAVLLGQDALRALRVVMEAEGDRHIVTFREPAPGAKAVLRGGKTLWIPLSGKAPAARR